MAIDPILGMAFGVVPLWASFGVIREAVHILMEGTLTGISVRERPAVPASVTDTPVQKRRPQQC